MTKNEVDNYTKYEIVWPFVSITKFSSFVPSRLSPT
jgi:hypothetical protein